MNGVGHRERHDDNGCGERDWCEQDIEMPREPHGRQGRQQDHPQRCQHTQETA